MEYLNLLALFIGIAVIVWLVKQPIISDYSYLYRQKPNNNTAQPPLNDLPWNYQAGIEPGPRRLNRL